MRWISILLLAFCIGCSGITQPKLVNGPQPLLPMPTRPQLTIPADEELNKIEPKTRDALVDSVYKLTGHVEVLEGVIKDYNQDARQHNIKVVEQLGLDPQLVKTLNKSLLEDPIPLQP